MAFILMHDQISDSDHSALCVEVCDRKATDKGIRTYLWQNSQRQDMILSAAKLEGFRAIQGWFDL